MDLRRKLRLLSFAREPAAAPPDAEPVAPSAAAAGGDARNETIARLRALIADAAARQARRTDLRPARPPEEPLPGELRETPDGPVHVIERFLEPRHCHGRVPIASALSAEPPLVARLALDETLASVALDRALLLDTETTGLSGGAGTLPFLVGLARFEEGVLRVEQLFLRAPGEEAPVLAFFAARLREASCVVTYNGKSFDWPLLRTRFVLNRVPMPEQPPHLDLLHCARRVYRRRLERVRLVDLEAELLGLRRDDDIEGAEIPRRYLGWLRSADPAPLRAVIDHNARDVIALAALLGELARRFRAALPEADPRDQLGFAEVAARAGDEARAVSFARTAAEGGGDLASTIAASLLLARLARRRRDTDAEEDALLRAVARAPASHAVHLALAKLYEHRRRDPARALTHASLLDPPDARRVTRLGDRVARAAARLGG